MTKAQAKAIIACRDKIQKALDQCEPKLSPDGRAYMQAYWGAHIRSSISGTSYGSMPVADADLVLEESP